MHDSHFLIVRDLLSTSPKLPYVNNLGYLQKASHWQ